MIESEPIAHSAQPTFKQRIFGDPVPQSQARASYLEVTTFRISDFGIDHVSVGALGTVRKDAWYSTAAPSPC